MTSDRTSDVELFTEAIELPIEERIAFLNRACADDAERRRRIEALLRSNERAVDFLETPPTGSLGEARAKISAGEKPGDQIDKYKLVQQIGEGGCGIVFMAEQERPVRRRVALKIIKPGMDTKSVIARFEAERQALALMDHPNIAHVFDAGATESGRPYFVMELVEGVKITDYCDRHSLPIDDRLGLFTQVCDAIQHAHQKGIIHRDIKPSNVLVTDGPDRKPATKIIDFGIAKATAGQVLTDKTIFTAAEMLIGTPTYMSPEQTALASTEVDTRTDIYSLGVLLYELLTGTPPYDARELLKVGFDEVRRVIREKEPLRPSTRLSTMNREELAGVCRQRHEEPSALIRKLRGELDWIVMMALEKDRRRRYKTANGLAMDVQRYLANETVLARPPSKLYKLQKLVVRNKLVFAAIGTVAVLLVTSVILLSAALGRERETRRQAVRDKEKAQQVMKFVVQLADNSDGVMNTLHHLADIVEADGKVAEAEKMRSEAMPFFETCKGLSEYRLGHFADAVAWAKKSIDSRRNDAHPHAYGVLALAEWRLGNQEQARAALAAGEKLAPREMPTAIAKDPDTAWLVWLFSRIQLDEAEALILPASSPTSQSKPLSQDR